MPDFHQIRLQQQAARAETSKRAAALFLAREHHGRIEAQEQELARTIGKEAAAQKLAGAKQNASKHVDAAKSAWDGALQAEQTLAATVVQVTDPRDAMQFLEDSTPILMFPVRLETRFRPNLTPPELWVRVYPDDCQVDTFEPTLSDDELQNVRGYWAGVFQAGRNPDQERGAWRTLAMNHGPGRAEWLIGQHVPTNLGTRMTKANAHDVILTIVTDEPLPADAGKIAVYWANVWLADGDKTKEDAAAAGLDPALLGLAQTKYVPTNVKDDPALPLRRGDVQVFVVWVLVPKVDPGTLRRRAWSRAAVVDTLPDRFVFIGYNPGQAPYVKLGGLIPSSLSVGPDPAAPKETRLKHREDDSGDLDFPDDMQWMIDFERAVDVGMGFRIDLTDAKATGGFARVIVAGVRVTDDKQQGQQRLETLFTHHRFSRSGFALVPQGTPTNNTDHGPAGWSRTADADEAFDLLAKTSLFTETANPLKKRDGQWLAEYLGIDPMTVERVLHADGRDQSDARAMNIALWPATMGYWMESMMAPVLDDEQVVAATRDFFTSHVRGRGAIPAVRIGKQPYGILPATPWSHMDWITKPDQSTANPAGPFLRELHRILSLMRADWELFRLKVSHTGKSGDAHQLLLDIVALESGSSELFQRWTQSLEQLYHLIALFNPDFADGLDPEKWLKDAMAHLQHFAGGWAVRPPELLKKFFIGKTNLVTKPVDPAPLSESATLTVTRADGDNYIEWLIAAAQTSLGAIYAQEGFGTKRPNALLYVMLRHALQLGYHDVSIVLHQLEAGARKQARIDKPFLNIALQQAAGQSRYDLLFKKEQAITGNAVQRVDEFIATKLQSNVDWYLKRQIAALEELKDASTARLERAFVEHIDTCSYRLDSWILGLAHLQLERMRAIDANDATAVRRGIYLGAYAWLEDLRPEKKTLAPAKLDSEQQAEFAGSPQLMTDSNNFGYIHAPSLNQAVAAAVLRNGYKQNATKQNPNTLAVNLTSERVRAAMAMIEGIRNGQSLGALLGYQFERGLHDRHDEAEVDDLIYDIRAKFPLAGNKLQSTKVAVLKNVREVEARNVVDGLALIEHITKTGNASYPFGFDDLPDLPDAGAALGAINAEVDRLRETHDAVSDLATAEGVYQAILGNYDRAGSTYDAYAKGTLPPEPQVVRTPASGESLTHRLALHLDPNAPAGPTPRSIAEPAINAWLAGVLPALSTIGCTVSFRNTSNATQSGTVTLGNLALSARDVLELVHDGRQAMNELDDRITRFVLATQPVRPDEPVTIRYREFAGGIPIFEAMPLVRALRTLFDGARALRPTDLTLSREAATSDDDAMTIDATRITDTRAQLFDVNAALDGYISPHELLLADKVANHAAILAGIDTDIDALAGILASAALFGLPQTGWGFAYDMRGGIFKAILAKTAKAAQTLSDRNDEYLATLAQDDIALPDAERFDILYRAERLISTGVTETSSPDALRTALTTVEHPQFLSVLGDLQDVQNTSLRPLSALLAHVKSLPALKPFTFENLSFQEQETAILTLAEDLLRLATAVRAEGKKRFDEAGALIAKANAAASTDARNKALDGAAKAMLGEHFTLIPSFALEAKQGIELDLSRNAPLLAHLTPNDPFPLDTWLYGLARVRDKLRAWEETIVLSEAFGNGSPLPLAAMQLPFVDSEPWLGLEFPIDLKVEGERLLYTASFSAPFDKNAPQCGVLIDEWTEVIPQRDLDTGIAFHFDRPSNEAPQAMLLVTPSDQRGKWLWQDVVDALNDTLDFAKRRAVEPDHFHDTQYPRFLPATLMAVTFGQLSISGAMIDPNVKVTSV